MQDNIHTSFAKAQSEFPKVNKEANNPFFKNKYASLDNILEVVLPILHKNGLYLTQGPVSDERGVGVNTSVTHVVSGDSIENVFTLPLAKQDPQGAGSAITYARRYALQSILGLNFEDDDDANVASKKTVSKTSLADERPNEVSFDY